MTDTPLYSVWRGMLNRCRNPRMHNWSLYGGRGVKVCDRWLTFENFAEDVGPHPGKGQSIERIDVNGDYEPGNVTWIRTPLQARNRRNQKLTLETAREIRKLRAAGWTYKRLSDHFGQSTGNLHGIVQGSKWKECA